jgi:hypothetical protein
LIAEPFNQLIELMFSPLEGSVSAAAPVGLLLLGLVTGLRHSMEADHVAAVSTIVAASGQHNLRRAPLLGLMWGLGHTATLLAAGLIVLLLAITIPERVIGSLEFGVGVMLIFLGATTLTGFNVGRFLHGIAGKSRTHSHEHIHKETGVVHSHNHDHRHDHRHGHKSLMVGMIHGMLVVLSTISSVPLGLAYIAIFGAGSIGSMAAMSALIGLPFARVGNYRRTSLLLRYAAAVITLVIGIGLVYELGIVKQVFL